VLRNELWIVGARLITPQGIVDGAVKITRGRIAEIRRTAPRFQKAISLRGTFLAPGFIDLHVWGEPHDLSQDLVRQGMTAFLRAIGPQRPQELLDELEHTRAARGLSGAQCLGAHLEGPFLNPARAGALPKRWMRRPNRRELQAIVRSGAARLVTIAPELPGSLEAIRWFRTHRIVASLGHSDADFETTQRAINAGASSVTHVFNGMAPFHHRKPGLLGAALTDPRLTTMAIVDGVHVGFEAFRLLVRAKGCHRVALVTDSIRHQNWQVTRQGGAYYLAGRAGTLAGSDLTMMRAVRNAVESGGVDLADAVRMASEVPAHLLGDRSRGRLEVGRRADLVAFDRRFNVRLTMVGGQIVHQRGL